MAIDIQKAIDVSTLAVTTAGAVVLEYKRNQLIESVMVQRQVINYENGCPVGKPYMRELKKTTADILSHDTLVTLLRREFPEYPILSEEEYIKLDSTPKDLPYFIVDPIDGTIHLEKGSPQWSINVALCLNGEPLIGVVVIPEENNIYIGNKFL